MEASSSVLISVWSVILRDLILSLHITQPSLSLAWRDFQRLSAAVGANAEPPSVLSRRAPGAVVSQPL